MIFYTILFSNLRKHDYLLVYALNFIKNSAYKYKIILIYIQK